VCGRARASRSRGSRARACATRRRCAMPMGCSRDATGTCEVPFALRPKLTARSIPLLERKRKKPQKPHTPHRPRRGQSRHATRDTRATHRPSPGRTHGKSGEPNPRARGTFAVGDGCTGIGNTRPRAARSRFTRLQSFLSVRCDLSGPVSAVGGPETRGREIHHSSHDSERPRFPARARDREWNVTEGILGGRNPNGPFPRHPGAKPKAKTPPSAEKEERDSDRPR
jgi:hypothetical protein